MRYFISVLYLVFFAFSSSVISTQSFAQTAQKTELSETEQSADIETVTKIRKIFQEIEAFNNVFVTVHSGVVTMKGKVLEIEDISKAESLAEKVEGVVSINNQIQVETSVEKRLQPAFERLVERLQQIVSFLPIVAIALFVLLLISAIGFAIAGFRKPFDSVSPNKFVANLLRQIVRIIFVVLGAVIALDIAGATALMGTILGAAGILGLAIGFAVRDTVENYLASVLLSFRQPFRPRDCVKIGEHEGYVIALTSRATVLLTYDGNHVTIPNATVYKGTLINFTLNPERRFSFTLDVVTEDLSNAVEIGVATIRSLEFVLKEPLADGWIQSVDDSRVSLWFGGWINQNDHSLVKSKSEAIRQVRTAFGEAGIEIAEPLVRMTQDLPGSAKTAKKTVTKKTRKTKASSADHTADVSTDSHFENILEEQERLHLEDDLLEEVEKTRLRDTGQT